jgi:hypothetical protein
VASFFRVHGGHQFASSVLMDPISKSFIAALEQMARRQEIPVVQFRKGQRKDDIAAEQRKKFTKPEGVVFIGKAQEKVPVFRTERRRNETTGATYPWLVRSTAMVNQFYIYCVDRDAAGVTVNEVADPRAELRPLLSEVQQLLPLHGQAMHQRT